MQTEERQGIYLMLKGAFFFALMALCIKMIPIQIPAIEILLARSLIGFFCIIPYLLTNKISFLGFNRPVLIMRSLFGFAALLCFFYCLQTLKLANAVMLNYTSPVFTTLLASLLLGEKVTRKMFALLFVSFVGVYCLIKPGFAVYSTANLVGLLSGFLAACAYTSIRKLRQTDSPFTVIFYFTGLSLVLSLPLIIPIFVVPGSTDILLMLGVGLFGHLGQLNMTTAFMKTQASIVANFAYFTVFFSSLFGIIFLSEGLTQATVIGSGLIIASGIILGRHTHGK